MSVRAKFKVDHIGATSADGELRTVTLRPVYDTNPDTENGQYWKYTPSGMAQLSTVNEKAWSQFKEGQEFYIDFTPAE